MSSASGDDYGAIERAYGEGRFADALQRAEQLLAELQKSDANPEAEMALSRLQLLTGHIHLYGLGQPEDAQAYYRAVTSSAAPSTLVDLAEASLKRCKQRPTSQPNPKPQRAQGAANSADLPATPWLSQLSEPQEALTALQSASVPGSPATPWGEHTPNEQATPTDSEPVENETPAEASDEVEILVEAAEPETSPPWPDYSQGNLVVELPQSTDLPPSENRPQHPLNQGQSWRRFFRLRRL